MSLTNASMSSDYDIAALLYEKRRRKATESLQAFTLFTKPNYVLNWHHELVFKKLDQFVAGEIKRLIICMPPQNGKQVSDSTPVLTTEGWKTHGELKVGDFVFSPSGNPIKVLAVGEKTRSDYVITFSNSQKIRCHGAHEWNIYDRSNGIERTVETKWFKRITKSGKEVKLITGSQKKRCTYQLPLSLELQFDEKDLPMHPYVLGAWLGDGSRSKPCITHDIKDQAVIDRIQSCGYNVSAVCIHKTTGCYTTYFGGPKPGISGRMTSELKALGLRNNKFIPEIYLRSSVEQRLQLLAGLLDTDGCRDPNSRYIFTTVDTSLATGVYDICLTLGFRPTVQTVQPALSSSGIQGRKPYFRVCFNPTMYIPCALNRKKITRIAAQRRIGITNVEYSPNGEKGHCIQVDSADGLYLVGETLITTHNSEAVSRRLPAFLFGRHPDCRIISCSYSADLAQRMNRDVQRIVDSPEYAALFPDVYLNESNVRTDAHGSYMRNSDIFEIVGHEGVYRSCGIGGGITGMSMDYGIIDDYLKNREEAESPTIRNKIYEWYTDVFGTREQGNSSILITATRWNEDDLIGRVLEKAKNDPEADQWEVISLPAMSEEVRPDYDPRTDIDQPLWPWKYSVKWLKKRRANVPVYTWLSLYQQRPSSAQGNLFKRDSFQYFSESPFTYDLKTKQGTEQVIEQVPKNSCVVFQTCDPAGTIKTHSDYFVLATWALTPKKNLLLLEVFRTKIEGADHMEFFRKHSKFPGLVLIGFESVGIGKTTYQNLVRDRFPVVDLQPKGDKFSRALSAAIRLNMGTTYFREFAHWLPEFETELLQFPNSKNDDQVDVLSEADYCITNDIIRLPGPVPISPRPTDSHTRSSFYGDTGTPQW